MTIESWKINMHYFIHLSFRTQVADMRTRLEHSSPGSTLIQRYKSDSPKLQNDQIHVFIGQSLLTLYVCMSTNSFTRFHLRI